MKYAKFDLEGKLIARYDSQIHGDTTLVIQDPAWVRPTVLVEIGGVLTDMPDDAAIPNLLEVSNPDCKIPSDALSISDDLFARSINETDGVWIRDTVSGVISKQPIPAESIASTQDRCRGQIDQACGNKRASIVSPGAYIAEEYRRAYDDSVAYKAAGYPSTVPASVQSWATAAGITPKAAADDIIATRDGYMALLDAIRDIRLTGKAAVDAATTSEQITAALDSVNTSLAAL